MLKFEWIGNFNPFEFISCPICGENMFTSMSGSSVYCDKCNCRFSVRYTSGDPGCVVDADGKDLYGQSYQCPECTLRKYSLEKSLKCPHCKSDMVPQVGYSGPILDKPPKRFYMVLKIGDYVSGWLDADASTTEGAKAHPSCNDRTLQTKWDEFQNRPDFRVDPEKLPGGVRFQTVMGESLSSSGIAAS